MKKLDSYFAYLDELREHGDGAHMYAAPSYLASFYGLTNVEAMEVCFAWLKTYKEGQSRDERVACALASRRPAA